MSNIKELIRQKIDAYYTEYKTKFHQNGDSYHLGIIDGLDMAERILDTLPDEPITTCNELAEAAEDFVWRVMEDDENGISDLCRKLRPTSKISDFYDALGEFFKAGAEWQLHKNNKRK